MRWRSGGHEHQNVPLNEEGYDDDGDGSIGSMPDLDVERDHESTPDQRLTDDDEDSLPTGSLTSDYRERMREFHKLDKRDERGKKIAYKTYLRDQALANPTVIEDDDPGSDHSLPVDDIEWKPQEQHSTCEFTHTIMDYADKRESGCKKAEYSDTTIDEFGNRWRLIIYVNGNGRASNHHLSLFLQVADADDLPFGWKKQVSYVLTLEHPDGSNLGYAKRNPDKMFKLCPKAIDWGWSQFITSDRIQQEGFISNDSLTVRASVTVKSSSVSIDSEDSELYLKCAVEEGNPDAVEVCLGQGASVNCQFKDDLYTPLHTACSSSSIPGSLDVLKLLLDRGADGNACNKWRETPLLIAANNGHTTAVDALLRHGADPSLCSEAGWSALTFAAHKGYDDIVALLLKEHAPVNVCVTEDNSTPLHKGCAGSKSGHIAAVKQLLDAGADVHALNKWRETPLLTAANHGQAKAVEALLTFEADPCKCTDTGWSPLSIAAYKGHDEVVELLLDAGAPTEEDDPTLSALLQAATKGLPDTVELLLRHGADHTVTTKKGDTALSILVEQDLIDTAVEMVTKYKASIPRCSRDRKKVQRARLLINLRMKQMQRDGLLSLSTDDETDDSESEKSKSALHDNGDGISKAPPANKKKKKKTKTSKESAEAHARAAEEALLRELEQEDAKAEKDEAVANSKRAKKKKKKERERQHRMKEEEEKRENEARATEERERQRKLQDEKERIEREERARERREQEAADRERAFKKNKEKEEKERKKRELERQKKEKVDAAASRQEKRSMGPFRGKAAKNSSHKGQGTPPPNENRALHSSMSPGTPSSGQAGSSTKSRGWEARSPVPPINSASALSPTSPSHSSTVHTPTQSGSEDLLSAAAGSVVGLGSRSPSRGADAITRSIPAVRSGASRDNLPQDRHNLTRPLASAQLINGDELRSASLIELPAVSLYRQEKCAEILQRCAQARAQSDPSDPLRAIEEAWLKVAMCRWVARAAHDSSPYLDCVIPSWTDLDLLTAFFQRQFIAESRKGVGHAGFTGVVSIEALREAGAAAALFCHTQAKALVEIARRLNEQLPPEWTDSMLGLTASEVSRNGLGQVVMIDWANRAQVYVQSYTFSRLRERYVGATGKILTSMFSAKTRRDLMGALAVGTTMDYSLSSEAQSSFVKEANVSVELWTDPFSSSGGAAFCGRFPDTDAAFGGLPPFGKENGGGEISLLRHGGSLSVLPPVDSMVSSLYVRKIIDLLEATDASRLPLSCVLVLHSDCFRELNRPPTINDLTILDPRLNEHHGAYVRFAEVLPAGQHSFVRGNSPGLSEVCHTASLFVVMQNGTGHTRFALTEMSVIRMIQAMGVAVISPAPTNVPVVPSGGYASSNGFVSSPPVLPHSAYDVGIGGLSPRPQRQSAPPSEFSAMGGSAIGASFSSESWNSSRRGRLFDLVDDGDDDNAADVDVVSGLLGNLNLFQNNPSQDVDIEAISLMGIRGPPSSGQDPTVGGYGSASSRTTSRFAS